MEEVRNWKLKKIIRVVNQIAEAKINQGVLLKELAHSIQANQKSKSVQEWKDYIYRALNSMVEKEQEMIPNEPT